MLLLHDGLEFSERAPGTRGAGILMVKKEYVPLDEEEMTTLIRVMPRCYRLHFGLGGYLDKKACPEAYRELLIMREQLCPDFLMADRG